jgi:hypothetical protein
MMKPRELEMRDDRKRDMLLHAADARELWVRLREIFAPKQIRKT